jgi:hypothetical protein
MTCNGCGISSPHVSKRSAGAIIWQWSGNDLKGPALTSTPTRVTGTAGPHPQEEPGHVAGPKGRWTVKAVVGVAALVVAAHLVLGGSVPAASRWLGWGVGAILLAVVLVKVIGVGGLAARHRHRGTR